MLYEVITGSQFYIVQGEVLSDADLNKIENQMREGKRRAIFSELITEYNDSLNILQSKGDGEALMALQQKIMALVNQKYSEEPELAIPDEVKEVYKTVRNNFV